MKNYNIIIYTVDNMKLYPYFIFRFFYFLFILSTLYNNYILFPFTCFLFPFLAFYFSFCVFISLFVFFIILFVSFITLFVSFITLFVYVTTNKQKKAEKRHRKTPFSFPFFDFPFDHADKQA